jgi:hypothetical protein
VNNLTFGCGTQHGIVQPGKWSTRKNARGDIEGTPPHLEGGNPAPTPTGTRKTPPDGDDEDAA